MFLADPVIARATLLYGLPVSGSRTQTTANSFTWSVRVICFAIRKARLHEHFLWSELLPVLARFSDHIHSQPFQEQTMSKWLAFVEIRIDREEHYGSIACCNVPKILEEYYRPTTGFTLAAMSCDKLVKIIRSPFCSVVVKDYFRLFIFIFIMYFSVVMLCGQLEMRMTFFPRLGMYDTSVFSPRKAEELELILLCLVSRSAGGKKRRLCLTVPQYVIF